MGQNLYKMRWKLLDKRLIVQLHRNARNTFLFFLLLRHKKLFVGLHLFLDACHDLLFGCSQNGELADLTC